MADVWEGEGYFSMRAENVLVFTKSDLQWRLVLRMLALIDEYI